MLRGAIFRCDCQSPSLLPRRIRDFGMQFVLGFDEIRRPKMYLCGNPNRGFHNWREYRHVFCFYDVPPICLAPLDLYCPTQVVCYISRSDGCGNGDGTRIALLLFSTHPEQRYLEKPLSYSLIYSLSISFPYCVAGLEILRCGL